jgi:serine-type D-Ala-D-Ala carboxypeptidase
MPYHQSRMNTRESLLPLLEDVGNQDENFAVAFACIREAIARKSFPGASIAVNYRGRLAALKAFGHFTYETDSPAVTCGTLFDLASVTKVVATTAMAMILYERGLLDMDAPLAAVVPEFLSDAERDARRSEVTIRMILAHSSGLPAYARLFLKAQTRAELLQTAFTMPLLADPGTRAEYSDIGFILVGIALERLADEPLDSFCRREIFAPLGMTNTTFKPPRDIRSQIPPTLDDRVFRCRVVQGEVQDENASVMGGVAGHAGAFSTAADLSKFAHALINGGRPILRPETVALCTRREFAPPGTSRALGWDTPSPPSQSGRYFGPRSFGHLGYTGTSLWIDPDRQLSIVLLTNRSWPDNANQTIKQVRPQFHDAVVEGVERIGWPDRP